MPFHADKPYYVHRMKEANRLVSFAMRREPNDYYNFINRPPLDELAEEAGNATAAEFSHIFNEESEAVDLYKAAIQDIIPPFETIAHQQPNLTPTQAHHIMAHDTTIATYGLLASMSQEVMHELYQHAASHVRLSEEKDAITLVNPVASSPSFGCEAVDAHSGQPEMSPLFRKFIPWAGSLAVLAYYEKGA